MDMHFAAVHSFIEWVEGHYDEVRTHMATFDEYQGSLDDHLRSIMHLGIVVCANRVRTLVDACRTIDVPCDHTMPLPSDAAVAWLYDSPQGKAAASPRY